MEPDEPPEGPSPAYVLLASLFGCLFGAAILYLLWAALRSL